MRKTALIINPLSGRSSKKKVEDFINQLNKHGIEVSIFLTEYPGHATELAEELEKRNDIDFIIVAGGDGTINEVINGFNSYNKPLAIIPFGSANVLACELGINSIKDSLNAILEGNLINCYIGNILSEEKSKKFLLMAGVGFDGYVVKNVRFKGSSFIKKKLFVIEGIKRFFKKDKEMMEIITDGRKISCYHAIICKASKYGGNFTIARRGIIKEPVFEILAITQNSRILLLKFFFSVLFNLPYPMEVHTFFTNNLEVKGEKPVQIDGEFFGYAPCNISLDSKTLRIFTLLS